MCVYLEALTSQLLCGNPAVRTTESHHVRPARCRGQLPRVAMFSRPAVTENLYLYLLSMFARRSGSTIVWSSAAYQQTLFSFKPHSLCFPLFWGKFIYRPTFDCPCERYLTMMCMLYGGDFQYDPTVHAVWWGFSI